MRKLLSWLFPIITYIIGIITLVVSLFFIDVTAVDIIVIILVPILPFLLPIFTKITKKEVPLFINILVCIEIILCIYGGNILNLYQYISIYDLILHCYFGFVCSTILYYIIMQVEGTKVNKVLLYFLIMLATLGVGGLWEIWEYACDTIGGGDLQRVQESLALGLSPIKDTMEDLIITFVGVCFFYLTLYLDKFSDKKLFKDFYKKEE